MENGIIEKTFQLSILNFQFHWTFKTFELFEL